MYPSVKVPSVMDIIPSIFRHQSALMPLPLLARINICPFLSFLTLGLRSVSRPPSHSTIYHFDRTTACFPLMFYGNIAEHYKAIFHA